MLDLRGRSRTMVGRVQVDGHRSPAAGIRKIAGRSSSVSRRICSGQRLIRQLRQDQIDAFAAQQVPGSPHGGQRRGDGPGFLDVIESGHNHIVRDADPVCLQSLHRANRHVVVGRNQRVKSHPAGVDQLSRPLQSLNTGGNRPERPGRDRREGRTARASRSKPGSGLQRPG